MAGPLSVCVVRRGRLLFAAHLRIGVCAVEFAPQGVRPFGRTSWLLKAKPGYDNYGSNGNGTAQHLIGTQFENITGTDLVHIPYKGSGPLASDLLGGQVTMSFDTVSRTRR